MLHCQWMSLKYAKVYPIIKTKNNFTVILRHLEAYALGNHIFIVVVRGLASPWKQVIACEVTGMKVDAVALEEALDNIIKFTEDWALLVLSVTSDMGDTNRSFSIQNVKIQKNHNRKNHFSSNGHEILIHYAWYVTYY